MSVYSNAMQIHLNEVAIVDFRENTQMGNQSVTSVAMTYEVLKQFRDTLNQVIEQHDKKLNELQRTKANMN